MELIQGTLDMLVLRTLLLTPMHGYAIAKAIRTNSSDALDVEFGSLYPALKRLVTSRINMMQPDVLPRKAAAWRGSLCRLRFPAPPTTRPIKWCSGTGPH